MSLDQVKASIEAREFVQALETALTAWRANPQPAIADVIDWLQNQVEPPRVAPREREAMQQLWLQVAREPSTVELGWLAQTLTAKLSFDTDHFGILKPDYTQTKYATWFERLTALAKFDPDPRVATALTEVLEQPKFSVYDFEKSAPLYREAAKILSNSMDLRVVRRLKPLIAAPTARQALLREVQQALIPPLVAALEGLPRQPFNDEQAWRALLPVQQGEADAKSQADLLARIVGEVDDDSSRLVLADLLSEAADPRGEFISLQIAQAQQRASTKDVKRANALLKKHKNEWLGPLAKVLVTEWRRGFVETATLQLNSAAEPATWAAAYGDARLGTLRVLTQGRGNETHLTRFLESPSLVNLQETEIPSYQAIHVLQRDALAMKLERLTLPTRGLKTHFKTVSQLQLNGIKVLTLQLASDDPFIALDLIKAMPWAQNLEAIAIEGGWHDQPLAQCVGAVWPALKRLKTLSLNSGGHRFEMTPKGMHYTFKSWFEKDATTCLQNPSVTLSRVTLQFPPTYRRDETKEGALQSLAEARGAVWQTETIAY